jgi:agmatine deiminase
MKLTMPAEWEKHERTWMSWPPNNYLLGDSSEEAELTRTTWANVANAIVKYEPVTVLATSDQIELARNYLHPSIEIVEAELNDAWLRDNGPTFSKSETGELVAFEHKFVSVS